MLFSHTVKGLFTFYVTLQVVGGKLTVTVLKNLVETLPFLRNDGERGWIEKFHKIA